MENRHPVPMYRLDPFRTIIWHFGTMLLVVVGQVLEVLGQTCTRASFPCGLWNGVSIDDGQVCVFSSKKDTRVQGVHFFHIFVCFKSKLHCKGF